MHRNYGNFIDEMSMYKHLHCVLNVLDTITFKFNTYFFIICFNFKIKIYKRNKVQKVHNDDIMLKKEESRLDLHEFVCNSVKNLKILRLGCGSKLIN